MAKGQQKKTTETASNKTDHSNGNTSNDDTIVDDEYMNTNSRVNAMTMKIDMWLLKVFKLRKPIDLCGVEVLYIEFNELAAELINEESPDKAALAQLFSYQSKVDQMFSYAKAVEKLQSAVLTMEEEMSFSPNWKDLEEACELIKHTERKFPFSDVHHNNWLEKLYEWKEKIEQQSVSSNRSQGSINSYTTAQRGDEFRVKIEKKKLAKFNGDPIDYYKFRHDILHYIIKNPQTKRALLKYHASIYDPFGFVLATTLKLKMMIHESWKLGYEWDDPLSPDLQKKARKIIHEIKELDQFSFPRRIFDKSVEEFDLMVFVDASQHAIGIASYLTNGQQLTLIYAKSKLIKPRKIVSAELLALSAGANTAKTLGDLVNARHIILFSDSMDNVKRLEEDMNKYPYPVAVHLFNIKSKISDIRHIRGEINPADAFTRGVTVDELKKLHRLNYHDIIELQDVVVGVGLTVNGSSEKYDISKFDLDSKRPYNQWIELVQQQSDDWKKSIDETMNELTILIKINQRRFLDDHFDKHIPTFCDDQGLVRCLTRLENSDLSYDEKYPIALPTCEFTLALMERTHENDEHGSVNYTLANFRMKYFTPRARQQFIKIKNRCSKCRQLRAKPLQVSLGNPPSTRLDRSHPFEHIGVDIFELKTDPKTIGMIFTCCVTRAVHFEVLENMTAECVCDAFQIFAALRRVPSTVYSDNGTNFKRLGNMFNEAYTVLKDNFQWRFNTPAAPFRGGFFESLIKSMKKGFYSIMWKKDIKPTMVRLVLYRIQSLMNARPLIHDNSTIVTPNHLMYGASSNGSLAPPRRGVQPSCLLKYWRGTQRLVDGAWKTYRDIYLKSLRNYHQNIKHYQYVQVGDEVLLVDKGLPVSLWTTGNIVETIPDARGVIRTYRVKAGDRIFERPAQRLAPLEAAFERREDM
ncbi:uncharacterized protein LOC124493697 isoform X2 [Dermatophagoides farinae]|uniref:uncharacterized protein LOC124493697 isoform X2 n=1 Tax=Dermatophagoides farinae TaxID=6954 RepID=UPI003F644584